VIPVPPLPGDDPALDQSIHGLHDTHPELSASRVLTLPQAFGLGTLLLALGTGLVLDPVAAGLCLSALVTLLYVCLLLRNLRLFPDLLSPATGGRRVSDAEALAIPVEVLPSYTVMVAAYREAAVIPRMLAALDGLDYPRDRLEVLLLLEQDDQATRAAVQSAGPAAYVRVVLVPPGGPRTKPKALNYGLTRARGELVTVYDAEDRPEPLQLRRAAFTFARSDPRVGCLQCTLGYHNPRQNLLTRWFALEYLTWFGHTLPAVAKGRTPVPLGGTSMHIRRRLLEQVGAWDAHNVTEDADLGVRLYRLGYRTEVLQSETLEEANSDPVNWVKQRSRWVKGYAQTWLVHTRHPWRLWRQLGTRGFVGFNLLVGGTTLASLLNPFMWILTLTWFTFQPPIVQAIFPGWVFYPALFSLLCGNFIGWYGGFVAVRGSGRPELLRAAVLMPVYWLLMSVGAIRAFVQITVSPFHWEKTVHGLDLPVQPTA